MHDWKPEIANQTRPKIESCQPLKACELWIWTSQFVLPRVVFVSAPPTVPTISDTMDPMMDCTVMSHVESSPTTEAARFKKYKGGVLPTLSICPATPQSNYRLPTSL